MVCKNCKATIPDESVFCPECGQKIEAKSESLPADESGFKKAGCLDGSDTDTTVGSVNADSDASKQTASKISLSESFGGDDALSTGESKKEPSTFSTEELVKNEVVSESLREEKTGTRFCPYCGGEIRIGAQFCANCGKKIGVNSRSTKKGFSTNLSESRSKIVAIGAGIAAILILVIVGIAAFSVFTARSYKATIDQYIEASISADAEAILDLIPDDVIDYMMDEEGLDDDELDEMIDDIEDELEDQLDKIEDYLDDDWKYSYEIVDTDDVTGKDLRELKETYEDCDVQISKAKTVEVEITIESESADFENSNTLEITVIKVGLSWYLDVTSGII